MQSLDNIKENVRKILIEYPETRGNDNLLIFRYFERHADEVIKNFAKYILYHYPDNVKKLTSFESIRRVRQKIQEEGAFLPSEEVVTARRGREADMRRWANSE